jgi:PAS domain S-box-containing protein
MLTLDGRERVMGADDLIVSKTNLKGHVIYANDTFLDIAGYTADEILGKPHSIVRNAAMPRCIFRLLWETINAGREIFAYVANRTKGGDYYWVLAHVTPSFGSDGQINGFHSNRRKPTPAAIAKISELYDVLLEEERRHKNGKQSVNASYALLHRILEEKGVDYDRFVLAL